MKDERNWAGQKTGFDQSNLNGEVKPLADWSDCFVIDIIILESGLQKRWEAGKSVLHMMKDHAYNHAHRLICRHEAEKALASTHLKSLHVLGKVSLIYEIWEIYD